MRLPKTSTRQRSVAAALTLFVLGLSPTAIGAKHKLLDGQAGTDPLALRHTSYAVSGAPILIRHFIRNTPERDFASAGPALVGVGGAVGSRPPPAPPDSGLILILVGFSLVGGAVFMRWIKPGQLSWRRHAFAASPSVDFTPEGVLRGPQKDGRV